MKRLKSIFKRLETIMAAASFAEEGEVKTAIEIMRDRKETEKRDRKRTDREYRSRLVLTAHK